MHVEFRFLEETSANDITDHEAGRVGFVTPKEVVDAVKNEYNEH